MAEAKDDGGSAAAVLDDGVLVIPDGDSYFSGVFGDAVLEKNAEAVSNRITFANDGTFRREHQDFRRWSMGAGWDARDYSTGPSGGCTMTASGTYERDGAIVRCTAGYDVSFKFTHGWEMDDFEGKPGVDHFRSKSAFVGHLTAKGTIELETRTYEVDGDMAAAHRVPRAGEEIGRRGRPLQRVRLALSGVSL